MMKVAWNSPSNIALIKYWGKFDFQMPENPSLSFTLKHSLSNFEIKALKKETDKKSDGKLSMRFFFENKEKKNFEEKIKTYLLSQVELFPWIVEYDLEMSSSNTFPHSSGIASSASSMSALSLSLLSLDELISKTSHEHFYREASRLSRMASGSASRSVYGGLVSWGVNPSIAESSNLYATVFERAHEVFKDYCDSILIVDAGEKSVSSRAGHALMENHPFREERFKMALENHGLLVKALELGDLEQFIKIVEEEALTLHALMMTSRPSYILLRPESLALIEKIKSFRATEKTPVCFTIDAGPNIHLLYPKSYEKKVKSWIETELIKDLMGLKWIHDGVGSGPSQIDFSKEGLK